MKRVVSCLGASILALTGCDPCGGVVNCTEAPRIHVEGRVLETGPGIVVRGAKVTVAITSPVIDSAVTETDAEGLFAADIDVPATGVYTYDLAVGAPGERGYRSRGHTCLADGKRGSGCHVGVLGHRLYFPYILGLLFRGPDSAPLPARVGVTFTRTAGTPLYGDSVVNGVYHDTTDGFGVVQMMGLYAFAEVDDSVVGDVLVDMPSPFPPSTIRDLKLAPTAHFREGPVIINARVGPSLRHALEFRTAAGTPIPGVRVRFQRSNGIGTIQPEATATSGSDGRAVIDLRPLALGQITGQLIVDPPAPYSGFVISSLTLATHDDDETPVGAIYTLVPGGSGRSTSVAR